MSEPSPVLVERAEGVARVVLQRPEAMNAIDAPTAVALRDAVLELAEDDAVRCVVLAAEGRAFCAGADLREMAGGADDADLGDLLRERYHPTILALRRMPKPVVAAVQGPAVGVGLSLALSADLVLAAEEAYFLLAFVNIGLAPDGGASALVPDRIGTGRATRMAMLGERVAAPEALAWGLVDAVHPAEELPAAVDALATRLATGPTRSYAAIKAQREAWSGADLARQLDREADLQAELGRSEDLREGVAAFLERRPARFAGR